MLAGGYYTLLHTYVVKVRKSQKIFFLVFNSSKNHRKRFLISALANNTCSNQFQFNIPIIKCLHFSFDNFLDAKAEVGKNVCCFFGGTEDKKQFSWDFLTFIRLLAILIPFFAYIFIKVSRVGSSKSCSFDTKGSKLYILSSEEEATLHSALNTKVRG